MESEDESEDSENDKSLSIEKSDDDKSNDSDFKASRGGKHILGAKQVNDNSKSINGKSTPPAKKRDDKMKGKQQLQQSDTKSTKRLSDSQ